MRLPAYAAKTEPPVCEKGVTLLEVMIAVALLAVVMISVLLVVPTAMGLTGLADEDEIARNAADRALARIRAKVAGGTSPTDPSITGWTFTVDGLTAPTSGGGVHGTVTVSDGPDGAASPVKEVIVQIDWTSSWRSRTGAEGRDGRVVLTTLMGPPPP